jgi:pyruvate,water dikinase
LAGIIGGRGYVNLSVQVSASRPFFGGDSRKALRQATAWWGGVPDDLEIPLVPISTWTWLIRVLPSLTRYGMKMARLRRRIPGFVAGNPAHCAALIRRIREAGTGAELAALLRDEIKPYSLYAFFVAFSAGSDLPVRLESELRELVGPDDANALLSNLSGLSSTLESLGPLIGLGKVARGEMSRESYLEAYGHRGVNENEYAWPRPLEDPTWLDRQLAEFNKAPADVGAMMARQEAAFTGAWDRFCERYPRKAKSMRRRLEKAAQTTRDREAARSEATRSSMAVRAFAQRAGELTGVGEDVFFLTVHEVLSLLEGEDSARKLLPLRKETFERYRALPPYPTIIVGRFDPFRWAADPNRRSDIFVANAPAAAPEPEAGATIKGFPGALGIVQGTVRRLDRPEESGDFRTGEVLVTTLTNIGWTPIFPRAAAIVTDLGAPLSHSAIIARELGIPAVVGCGNATMRLHTGDRVRVDGGRGLVEILGSAAHAAENREA